jgi:hypothetical protein
MPGKRSLPQPTFADLGARKRQRAALGASGGAGRRPTSTLSDEIWLLVLGHLDFGSLAAVERVDRHFMRLANDGQLWKSLYFGAQPSVATSPSCQTAWADNRRSSPSTRARSCAGPRAQQQQHHQAFLPRTGDHRPPCQGSRSSYIGRGRRLQAPLQGELCRLRCRRWPSRLISPRSRSPSGPDQLHKRPLHPDLPTEHADHRTGRVDLCQYRERAPASTALAVAAGRHSRQAHSASADDTARSRLALPRHVLDKRDEGCPRREPVPRESGRCLAKRRLPGGRRTPDVHLGRSQSGAAAPVVEDGRQADRPRTRCPRLAL